MNRLTTHALLRRNASRSWRTASAPLLLLSSVALWACATEVSPEPGPEAVAGTGGSGGTSAGQGGVGTGGGGSGGTGGAAGGTGGTSGSSAGIGGAAGTNGPAGGAGNAAVGGSSGAEAAGSGGAGMTSTGGSSGSASAGAGSGGDGGVSGAAGSSGGAAGASGGQAGGGAGTAGASGGSSLPPITDYKAQGPFPTTVNMGVGPDGGYTVYRPSTLGENGFKHAPIIFGPGINQGVSVHTTMLTNFASHGFVVVGTPVLSGGPGDDGNLAKMRSGLDWIVAQNTMPGTYQGKLWVDHAISMGFSVGGTSAVELGGHAAVATVVSIHGHTATADLHGPMLQTTGTLDTVGMPLQQATYNSSQVQTFLATLTGANHPYIERNGGGDERPAILAWMRYWIYGDMGARGYFFGADCTLCDDPWENPQRKNWQ
jgi:hypothetical protein